MAGGFLSVLEAFSTGMNSSEEVCDGVHVSISVLVGFAQVEKPLAKFSNQVIGRVCGFLNCGEGCGG
jgi:hypothetical protein